MKLLSLSVNNRDEILKRGKHRKYKQAFEELDENLKLALIFKFRKLNS